MNWSPGSHLLSVCLIALIVGLGGGVATAVAQPPPANAAQPLKQISTFPQLTEGQNGERVVAIENSIIPANLFTQQVLALSDEAQRTGRPVRLKIANSKIEGEVVLLQKTIAIILELTGVTFGAVNCNEATFEDQLIVGDSVFEKNAFFWRAKFKKSASFSGSTFNELAWFYYAKFEGGHFAQTTFKGNAHFYLASFTGVSFLGASFLSRANFEDVRVEDVADFRWAKFNGPASFRGFVGGTVYLDEVVFTDSAAFVWARFTGQVTFSDARFKSDADFEGCEFPPVREHCLGGVDFSGVDFEKRLWLPFNTLVGPARWLPLTTQSLKLRHCHLAGHMRIRLFKQLKDKFRSAGDVADLNDAEYFDHATRTRDAEASDRVQGYFSEFLWGYGYRPWRTLFWLFVLLVVFAAVYWTQTAELKNPNARWQWARWKFSWLLSCGAAFRLKPVTDSARTLPFKIVIFTQWVLSKALLLLFLKALAKNTPLVGDLLDKLIPV